VAIQTHCIPFYGFVSAKLNFMNAYSICITYQLQTCFWQQSWEFPLSSPSDGFWNDIDLLSHINNLLVLSDWSSPTIQQSVKPKTAEFTIFSPVSSNSQIQQFANQLSNPISAHFSLSLSGIHTLVRNINVHI
jgi:hypothetical protein